jgi:hypothetical protein
MKKTKWYFLITLAAFLSITGIGNAFNGTIHREICLDAFYYMQHCTEATANQRDAAAWMCKTWGDPGSSVEWKKYPWTIIAQGAKDFDYMGNLCFDNDEFYSIHYTSGFGHDYTAYMHFLDLASKIGNWPHASHNNKKGGIHNDIDGYNYRRHNDYLAPNSWDIDDDISTWMGNDDFCIVHSGSLLDMYERDQGGADDSGRLISAANNSCYTRWDKGFDNIIFAPIDNLGNYWYNKAVAFGKNKYYGPYYLGYSFHAIGDCSAFQHLANSMGWGHAQYEDWADAWYTKREFDWFNFANVKSAIDNDFKVGGQAPANQDFRWLVNRLATLSYDKGRTLVWDRYTGKSTFDSSFDEDLKYVYPRAVACAVILMEKLYNNIGKPPSPGITPPPQQANIKLTITRVQAIDSVDTWGSADFYPKVSIAGQQFSKNYLEDKDDISPNWEFLVAVNTTPDDIPIKLEIWDSDGGLRGDDDHCDINGSGGKSDLNLNLRLSTKAISGDLAGSTGAVLSSAGGGDSDRAKIWFKIEIL